MRTAHTRLTITLVFIVLALLAFLGTSLTSSSIDFMYRDASGLTTVRSVAQAAAALAAVVTLVAGLLLAVPLALKPGPLLRKLLYVLPLYLLAVAAAAGVSNLLGVGALGNWFNIQGIGQFTFASAMLAFGGVAGAIGVVAGAVATPLGRRGLRPVVIVGAVAAVLCVVTAVAMVASAAIVSTSEPSSFGGPGGQFPPGMQNNGAPSDDAAFAPQATGEAAAAFPPGQDSDDAAFAPQATGEAAAFPPGQDSDDAALVPPSTQEASSGFPQPGNPDTPPGGSTEGQFQQRGDGDFPPGGGDFPPGGGGFGSDTNLVPRYTVGAALVALFSLIALVSGGSALLAGRGTSASASAAADDAAVAGWQPREIGLAVVSAVVLTVIFGAVIQVFPVERENPPVQTTLTWDSAETEALATSACMDCHSNQTEWPWYSYVAPMSWLTALHVNDAREELNFSELDSLPTFRRSMLAQQIAQQIRSGSMPPADYLLLHPDARLTDAEKEQLIQGFQGALSGS